MSPLIVAVFVVGAIAGAGGMLAMMIVLRLQFPSALRNWTGDQGCAEYTMEVGVVGGLISLDLTQGDESSLRAYRRHALKLARP